MNNSKTEIALLGNPNVGKTAVFNLLTGLNQKVSNYPGITVEKKSTELSIYDGEKNNNFIIEDYPGAYSLIPQSLDESLVCKSVYNWIRNPNQRPDAIVYVADTNNIRRNLYFLSQLLDIDIPVILLLNMDDIIEEYNKFDYIKLKNELNIEDVIPFSTITNKGLKELKKSLSRLEKKSFSNPENVKMKLSDSLVEIVNSISSITKKVFSTGDIASQSLSLRFLCNPIHINDIELNNKDRHLINKSVEASHSIINKEMSILLPTLESDLRYGWIDDLLLKCQFKKIKVIEKKSKSEKLDKVLTHSFFGPLIFIAILYFIFFYIFNVCEPPMKYIDEEMMPYLSNFIDSKMSSGLFRDLIIDGIIAGIGGIVVFLPQILMLMFFMTFLENTGYMARVSFMSDRFMRKMGLHGKSILPIMSGYACAIPGIISARTIDSWKERLITILILPLISCAARLPVYLLMVAAFFEEHQALIMIFLYFLGTTTALIIAKVFSKFLTEKSNPTFIMELPDYRWPNILSLLKQVYNRGKLFLLGAGKIIMIISIILWLLMSFPKVDGDSPNLDESYAGMMGKRIEFVIKPLGFDSKIGIALITSFAAREVMVSTLSSIYSLDDDDNKGLVDKIRNDKNFTPLVAVSIMIFYVYAAQCMATFAVVKTETNSYKWPVIMMIYMTSLAYFSSLIVYQFGKYLGF